MNARTSRTTIAAAAAVATAGAAASEPAEWPKTVHAYRRQPHLVLDPRTGMSVEKPVEVVCCGEKIQFTSNEAGHIVGLVNSKEAYDRLVKEIPEAYIAYAGGENLPTAPIVAAEHKHENVQRPEGQFVLTSKGPDGRPVYKVLDDMGDVDLRSFATEVGLTDEQLPAVLEGETLQRAIFNLLAGAAA